MVESIPLPSGAYLSNFYPLPLSLSFCPPVENCIDDFNSFYYILSVHHIYFPLLCCQSWLNHKIKISLLFVFRATFVGLAYGYATILSSSIAVPIASHAVNNLIGGLLWRYTSNTSAQKWNEELPSSYTHIRDQSMRFVCKCSNYWQHCCLPCKGKNPSLYIGYGFLS